MLNIVDGFQIKYGSQGFQNKQHTTLNTIHKKNQSSEENSRNNTQNSIIDEKRLSTFPFHHIHTAIRPKVGPEKKLIDSLIFSSRRRILQSTHSPMMSVEMLIGKMHVQIFAHM